ncbi:MAG: glycosyltransferase [Acidobacteria bacterium]|nr:glycosyltransferase [Acidobacteriota bacterium]
MTSRSNDKTHLLTILVEDYFHVGAFDSLIRKRNWPNFQTRYEQNTEKALELLDKSDTKATFFVLGWIAEQNPGLIKEIARRGHEVASRGFYHRGLVNLSRDEFKADLDRTTLAIESATGQKVLGHRAAEKLSFARDAWVLDALAEEGMAYDASFLPVRKDARELRTASVIETASGPIWEFPYSTIDLFAALVPISGGNYIRQIPYSITKHAIRRWDEAKKGPFVFYFHVWELDPEQPRISAASLRNKLRHYRKLDKMDWVVRDLLTTHRFDSVAGHLGLEGSLAADRGEMEFKGQTSAIAFADGAKTPTETPVTVVVPCYNEVESLPYLAKTLEGVRHELAERGYEMHATFVDDKSTDATYDKLAEYFGNDKNFRIIRHEKNLGVAGAIMTGIRASTTEIVCSIDCDCTYDPYEIAAMLPLFKNGVDLVTASPYHIGGRVKNVPGWRLFLSRGASFLYRKTLKSELATYTSCFRIYRRSSVADIEIKETGFLGVAELLGKLHIEGATIVEHPAVLEVRLFGLSKMKTAKTIAGHLKLLARLAKMRIFGKTASIRPSSQEEAIK